MTLNVLTETRCCQTNQTKPNQCQHAPCSTSVSPSPNPLVSILTFCTDNLGSIPRSGTVAIQIYVAWKSTSVLITKKTEVGVYTSKNNTGTTHRSLPHQKYK